MNYKHTILFVDDQNELLTLIDKKLENEPYNKLYASSVLEALNILEKIDVNVIITDMLMPDISGLKLLALVKKLYPNVVRIVLSGHAQVPAILDAINTGSVYRYITKPWKITPEAKSMLRDAIDHSLSLHRKNATTCNSEDISKEALVSLLDKLGTEHILFYKDKMIHCSESLSKFSDRPILSLSILLSEKYNYIQITDTLRGFFFKKA